MDLNLNKTGERTLSPNCNTHKRSLFRTTLKDLPFSPFQISNSFNWTNLATNVWVPFQCLNKNVFGKINKSRTNLEQAAHHFKPVLLCFAIKLFCVDFERWNYFCATFISKRKKDSFWEQQKLFFFVSPSVSLCFRMTLKPTHSPFPLFYLQNQSVCKYLEDRNCITELSTWSEFHENR